MKFVVIWCRHRSDSDRNWRGLQFNRFICDPLDTMSLNTVLSQLFLDIRPRTVANENAFISLNGQSIDQVGSRRTN